MPRLRLTTGRRLVLAAGVIASLAGTMITSPALAAPTAATSPEAQYDALLRRLAADGLAQVGFTLVRQATAPNVSQYRMCAMLLHRARQLIAGDDVDLLRSELEAWTAAGDRQNEFRATKELVTLDPKDTVAQLRLLNAGIERSQDAETRQAIYNKLLGPEGSKLDESIRSRLALDAALLAREMGDERGFLDKLTYAVTADITNKDAAALYAAYFLDRSTNPRERADILANLVLSDPLDAESHRNLGLELMRQGAYKAAERFLGLASMLLASTDKEPPDEDVLDYAIAVWNGYGPARALQVVQTVDVRARARIEKQKKELEAKGLVLKEEPMILIAPQLETVRLGIAVARGDEPEIARTLDRAIQVYERTAAELRRVNENPSPQVAEYIEKFEREAKLTSIWLRLLAGSDLDKATETLTELQGIPDLLSPDAVARYEGWLAARRGDTQKAREILTPLADRDSNARYALGVAAEIEGNTTLAVEEYTKLTDVERMTILGAIGRMRLERLTNKPYQPPGEIGELEQAMLNFAPFLNSVLSEPRNFVSLRIEHVQSRIDALGRVELRVRLRNEMGMSGIPLAVGSDKPINSRIMLSPNLSTSIVQQTQLMQPEVIRLDRRLRLKPGESIDTVFWAGRGMLGQVMDSATNFQCVLRWRAIQGFKVTTEGRYEPGAMCIGADSDILTREAIAFPPNAGAMADALAVAQGIDLLNAIYYTSWLLRASDTQLHRIREHNAKMPADRQVEIPPDLLRDRQVVISTLVQRFATMTSLERTIALVRTANGGWLEGDYLKQIVDELHDEESPYVIMALLAAIKTSPDDQVMAFVRSRKDPELVELAEVIRSWSADGQQTPESTLESEPVPELPAQTDAPPPASTTP